MRNEEEHNRQVEEVLQDASKVQEYGVKRACVLLKNLRYFHVVRGYPPDILHDFLEGIVPFELAICISDLIKKNYISLDMLNHAIKQFPYSFSDRVNKPHQIPKTFSSKSTIGGNGHENWRLIRLLPLLIGHLVPEGNETWEVLMVLNDILEMVVSHRFTEESLYILESKVADHRHLLLTAFPNCKLCPKHPYIEHYVQLIRVFGPLINTWTIRFEGKHSFFKKVIHETQNCKNVALTLARHHQKMMTCHLDSPSFFKPEIQVHIYSVTSLVSRLISFFVKCCSSCS